MHHDLYEMACLLVEYHANVNIQEKPSIAGGKSCLHYAVDKGHLKMTELLLSNGANTDLKDSAGMTPLHYAARAGYTELAKLLLARGANPIECDYRGKPPYYWARMYVNAEVMALLPVYTYDVLEEAEKRWAQNSLKEEKKEKKGGGKKKGGKKKK